MITPESIQTVIEAARVEEVVGDFVNLKKRGANYMGLCPFHNEKTPSFVVSPAKGIFKCFGCGKAGNPVNFIMEHEHCSYPEAIKYLAQKYNIELVEENVSDEQLHARDERESLLVATGFAQKHFTDMLHHHPEGKAIGLSYFRERGFRDDIIKKFQLGYGLQAWDGFTKEALKQGYKEEYLVKAGLTIAKEGKRYDRFRNRVIFPIHNLTGRVIAFGGRILTKDKNKPKYVNSPETEIYNKSKVLYGIFFAKSTIVSQDNCYLVEGYTDVISLHQSGIQNVVASSGTSLTTGQIQLIKRYTQNITILYDGDAAGIKASFRGIDMILSEGMNVKVVLFPDGEDPDSFARNHRTEEVLEYIKTSANDFIRFKTQLLAQDAAGDPIKRAGLIHEIVHSIAIIPDGIIRSAYLRECSSLLDMPEQTLIFELNKELRKKDKTQQKFQQQPEIENPEPPTLPETVEAAPGIEIKEKEIIRLLLLYGDQTIEFEQEDNEGNKQSIGVKTANLIVSELLKDEIKFTNTIYGKIFSEYINFFNQRTEPPNSNLFTQSHDKIISALAANILASPHEISHNWQERSKIYTLTEEDNLKHAVINALYLLKDKKLELLVHAKQKELKSAQNDGDVMTILYEIKQLETIRSAINKEIGRVVTGK